MGENAKVKKRRCRRSCRKLENGKNIRGNKVTPKKPSKLMENGVHFTLTYSSKFDCHFILHKEGKSFSK